VRIRNVHARAFAASPEQLAPLLDGLASPHDALWPRDRWPAMRLDRPLQVGAVGGHGPIRYRVEAYSPGRAVRFRLTAPSGFDGYHGFDLDAASPSGATLRHTLEMHLRGPAWLTWPLVFRPLHDALVEDCLDRAAQVLGTPPPPRRWSPYVRLLRGLFRLRLRRRAARGAGSA
jgi:hypothetical protein